MKDKGVLAILFDFSFSEFITTRVIKVLLGVAVIVNAIIIIVMIIGAFTTGDIVKGIIVLILSPIIYIIMMIIARIYLELIIVIFRIAENLIAIKEQLGKEEITQ